MRVAMKPSPSNEGYNMMKPSPSNESYNETLTI